MQTETPALDSRKIEKRFGYAFAVRNVSLQFQRGEFVVLFGSNGAGKTTFLRVAATLIRPTSGTVFVEGLDTRKHPEEARRRIGFLSHNTFVYRDLSALENLKFFCRLYGVKEDETRLLEILDRVDLKRRANDPVRSFSRGMQQRVGIARAVVSKPQLLIADEPTGNLDPALAIEVMLVFKRFQEVGVTVIIASHDPHLVETFGEREIVLDGGRIASDVLHAAAAARMTAKAPRLADLPDIRT